MSASLVRGLEQSGAPELVFYDTRPSSFINKTFVTGQTGDERGLLLKVLCESTPTPPPARTQLSFNLRTPASASSHAFHQLPNIQANTATSPVKIHHDGVQVVSPKNSSSVGRDVHYGVLLFSSCRVCTQNHIAGCEGIICHSDGSGPCQSEYVGAQAVDASCTSIHLICTRSNDAGSDSCSTVIADPNHVLRVGASSKDDLPADATCWSLSAACFIAVAIISSRRSEPRPLPHTPPRRAKPGLGTPDRMSNIPLFMLAVLL